MSDRTDERVTTIYNGLDYAQGLDVAGWPGHLRPVEVAMRVKRAVESLAADADETQKLRERVEAQERELNRAGFVLGISGDRRESIEYVLDKTVAERDAAVADRDRLAGTLAIWNEFGAARCPLCGADDVSPDEIAGCPESGCALRALAGREGRDRG